MKSEQINNTESSNEMEQNFDGIKTRLVAQFEIFHQQQENGLQQFLKLVQNELFHLNKEREDYLRKEGHLNQRLYELEQLQRDLQLKEKDFETQRQNAYKIYQERLSEVAQAEGRLALKKKNLMVRIRTY